MRPKKHCARFLRPIRPLCQRFEHRHHHWTRVDTVGAAASCVVKRTAPLVEFEECCIAV
jgi:hypothetical protein